ncbi:hypothetical protein EMCRGX_G010561 [Ephydatia muelleri]
MKDALDTTHEITKLIKFSSRHEAIFRANRQENDMLTDSSSSVDPYVHRNYTSWDRLNVSEKFYHELSMVQPTIPRSHRIKRVRSELNQSLKTKMYRVPGPNHGIQLNPDSSHEVFRIKLSGDGAKFSRCSNFFLVSFAILNLEQRVLSPRDNHTVAVVKMPECHDILATTLEPLLQEIKLLMESQIIEAIGKQYQVELFLGGDLKMSCIGSYVLWMFCLRVLQDVQLEVKVNKKQADPLQGAMLQLWRPFQIWRKDSGSSALDWTSLGRAGMRKVISKLPAYFKDILPQDCSECITQLWKVHVRN